MSVDLVSDLRKQVISNVLECLNIHGNGPDRGIELAQGLQNKVFPLVFEHGHDLGAVEEVLALLLLLGLLELFELLISSLQLLQSDGDIVEFLLLGDAFCCRRHFSFAFVGLTYISNLIN